MAALEALVSHPIARAIASNRDPSPRRGEACLALQSTNRDVVGRVALTQATRQGISGIVNGKKLVVGSEVFVRSHIIEDPSRPSSGLAPEWALSARRDMTSTCLTPVWVCVDGVVTTVIGVGSRLRDDATKTIQELGAMGHRIVILSGDDPDTVRSVGHQLELLPEDCRGGLSPEDKLQIVHNAQARGPALMVGDGVNDAAALSAASVGIAVHGGAEASLAAADVYIGRPGVNVLVELLDGSKRTLRVIYRCLGVSLAYNLVAAALATTGFINPLIAAVMMPLASFTVLGVALGSKTF